MELFSKDPGADYYNQFNKERKINAYLKKLKALWVGGSGSCRLNLLAEFKINVKRLMGKSALFGFPVLKFHSKITLYHIRLLLLSERQSSESFLPTALSDPALILQQSNGTD